MSIPFTRNADLEFFDGGAGLSHKAGIDQSKMLCRASIDRFWEAAPQRSSYAGMSVNAAERAFLMEWMAPDPPDVAMRHTAGFKICI